MDGLEDKRPFSSSRGFRQLVNGVALLHGIWGVFKTLSPFAVFEQTAIGNIR